MLRSIVLVGTLIASPALAENLGLLGITGQPFEPGAIVARIGSMRSGITLVFDNTRMTSENAKSYAETDCADFDRKLDALSMDAPTADTPHLTTARYTCR